ncbi:MAG TPA: GatB/YqeY domain-containing protein [Candidatus Krumholzibacteria bacterium]|nr:GatB/YqeY domain-containing protein [Candidatus Krumholzibacteria bacterium]HPD71099.1 GatB/YqeY domain-containing protein [Candidatus Krumholzibacteria bacterium]HRY39201.1 GatB/YqeY domain-containing protein [Candidatus Krumholzibacteria bacterium]
MPSQIAARLKADVIAAMKAKDKERLGVLRQVQAAIKQVEVDTRVALDDAGVLKVLQAYAKKVRDSIEGAEKARREDLVAASQAELALVKSYLPAELDDAELAAIVDAAIGEVGAAGPKDLGKVMKAVQPRVVGRAEGARVSAMVKARLAGRS